MIKYLGLFLVTISLVACETTGDDSTNSGQKTKDELFTVKPKPVTEPNSLMGLWEAAPENDRGVIVTVRAKFEEMDTTIAIRCEWSQNQIYYAQVSAAASYSQGSYSIIQANENNTYDQFGNLRCSAEIQPTQVKESQIKNGQMEINKLTFTKISD